MTTLADMTLRLARIVTDVVEGTSTAGSSTSLTDTNSLIQQDQYWQRGTLWIRSGAANGKVIHVTGFASNQLTFADVGTPAPGSGARYAVARSIYPYEQIVASIREALNETYVIEYDEPFTGDGETLAFELPSGVSKIVAIKLIDPESATTVSVSSHWHEEGGYLLFDADPPLEGWTIRVFYRTDHPDLVNPGDEISSQINEDWLRWKAAEYLLYYAMKLYGEAKEYRIEELMNRVLTNQKGKYPRKPIVIVKTVG